MERNPEVAKVEMALSKIVHLQVPHDHLTRLIGNYSVVAGLSLHISLFRRIINIVRHSMLLIRQKCCVELRHTPPVRHF